MTAEQRLAALARLVLETLNSQQRYFQTKDPAALKAAKQYETHLRRAATEALEQKQPELFE